MTDPSPNIHETETISVFPEEARKAFYEIIALRRDIRHFVPAAKIDEAALVRILDAAHHAPSVGFSQPWGFVIIRDQKRRERLRESFLRCREAEAARYPEDRRAAYLTYRLEGLIESSLNICVTVDLRPRPEAILGTTAQPEAVRASVACAVENLWLAARAEGIGVGWVSIIEPEVLRQELALPRGVHPVAYLCIGQPVAFRKAPMLEEVGWDARKPFASTVHQEVWSDHRRESTRPSKPPPEPKDERAKARERAAFHQTLLTKPRGSLGRLEELAVWYAAGRGAFPVRAPSNLVLGLFMADHGVAAEGVSAYSSEVTAGMACNVMAGGAAVSVLAKRAGVTIAATDVGISGDLSRAPTQPVVPLRSAPVRAGTANLRTADAMSRDECEAAMAVGRDVAREAVANGADLLGVGEIGIANTTSAAALVAALTGDDPDRLAGHGTGVDEAVRIRKAEIIREALARHATTHAPPRDAPLELLASLGGLEIAAMVGFILEATRLRTPVVLDGVVTMAAALVTRAIDPSVTSMLVASHMSPEPAFARAALELKLSPVLDLGLRLGEGTGAVLAMQLVAHAVGVADEMATFATAGVVGPSGSV